MENKRDFKGIWIPKDVWLDKRLNAIDKMILAEINSLDCEDGCFATNEYIADFCQCSQSQVTKSISKLKECGYIYLKSFDGRTRVLGCIIENRRQTHKIYEADSENLGQSNIIENNNIIKPKKDLKESVHKNQNYEELVGRYPNLKEPMERWLKYKKERKDKYTDTGLEDCFEKLQKLSGGDVTTAMKIVKQSTSNNWAGLFPLRGNVVLDEKPVMEWKGICTDILVLSRATYEERQKWSEKQKRVFDKLCRHEPLTEEDVNE